jgi:hypothetical protein
MLFSHLGPYGCRCVDHFVVCSPAPRVSVLGVPRPLRFLAKGAVVQPCQQPSYARHNSVAPPGNSLGVRSVHNRNPSPIHASVVCFCCLRRSHRARATREVTTVCPEHDRCVSTAGRRAGKIMGRPFASHSPRITRHCLPQPGTLTIRLGSSSPVSGVRWTPPESRHRTRATKGSRGTFPMPSQPGTRVRAEIALTHSKQRTGLLPARYSFAPAPKADPGAHPLARTGLTALPAADILSPSRPLRARLS